MLSEKSEFADRTDRSRHLAYIVRSSFRILPVWLLSIEAIYYAIAPAIIPLTHRTLFIFVAASGVAFLLFWCFIGEAARAAYGLQLFTFAWAWLASTHSA
jgi:peptidoglycan/LPS O-acetylase OafA/YrhL